MKLFSANDLVRVALILLLMVSFNCQRIKSLPTLFEPTYPPLVRLATEDYPVFSDYVDRENLIHALKNQISYFARLKKPGQYALGEKSISSETIRITLERFLQMLEEDNNKDLNQLIQTTFDLYQSTGENGTGIVTFTGYYLPLLEGSLKADRTYRYPLYRLPDDLIRREVPSSGRITAVRMENGREYPYYTRKHIDQEGVLAGRGYEIAYLKDPFDSYLLHVQGSGILILPDGTKLHLHFGGSNYHPYRSLREEMLKDGILHPDNASMESIRSYFAQHPHKLQAYLNRNKRYTFFSIWGNTMVGSLGVPLTPGRSIAVDKQIFPAGALSYVITTIPSVNPFYKKGATIPWSRFVLNQDEGGAIKGPHRVDIYWGTGTEAEYIAHHMKQPGKLYYLVLKDSVR
jgi:membrane-bound lytic murein transglycosylase A